MRPERKRRLVLIAVGIGASALVLGAAVRGPLRVRTEREFKPGTLPYLAKELKAKGVSKHRLSGWHVDYFYPVNGFDQFVDESEAVVVATLLDQRYRPSGDLERIETIAKFRVDDFLSGTIKRARGQLSGDRMPAGAKALAPLKEDEILVFYSGGTLMVDGLLFQQIGEYGNPPFKVGRQYVLFLHAMEPEPKYGNRYGNKYVRLYTTSLGPDGVYLVEQDSPSSAKIKTHGLGPYFKDELEKRFLSQKIHFAEHLRRMGRRPQNQWLEEEQ